MPKVTIDGSALHLKKFEVMTTGKNMLECMKMQRDLAKVDLKSKHLDDDDPESVVNFADAEINTIQKQYDFLKEILKLTKSQMEKVEDAPLGDVMTFVTQVANAILGYNSNSKSSKEK